MSGSELKEFLKVIRSSTGLNQLAICELIGIKVRMLQYYFSLPKPNGLVVEGIQNTVYNGKTLLAIFEKSPKNIGPNNELLRRLNDTLQIELNFERKLREEVTKERDHLKLIVTRGINQVIVKEEYAKHIKAEKSIS